MTYFFFLVVIFADIFVFFAINEATIILISLKKSKDEVRVEGRK